MDARDLERERQALIHRHGPWTHHNVRLGDGGRRSAQASRRARRTASSGSCRRSPTWSPSPSASCACSTWVPTRGSTRSSSALRAPRWWGSRSARRASPGRTSRGGSSASSVEFIQDDVRNLSIEDHGRFDVMLCLGLLYHLDTPDVFELLASISAVCARLALIDTNVSLGADEERRWWGRSYAGRRYFEHDPGSTPEERERSLKRSIDNPEAFWLTRASLVNALADVGFTSVQECLVPGRGTRRDRPTFMALKGEHQTLRAVPRAEGLRRWRWPQREHEVVHPNQHRLYRLAVRRPWLRRSAACVPAPVRRRLRRMVDR